MNCAIILLAAGSSSRLGQPKQLLKIGEETLLTHAIGIALKAYPSRVLVVIGANADANRQSTAHLPVEVIENKNWSSGMGSSIKAGIQHLLKSETTPDCAVIMVCDQPLVTAENISALIKVFTTQDCLIVASSYQNTLGTPALFDKTLFKKILALEDSHGAKKIIQQHIERTQTVDCPGAAVDIDTPDDYQHFIAGVK